MNPPARHLVIFCRAPALGRGKRRLARDIGAVEAAAFQRRILEATVRRLGRDPRWRTWLAVTPDRAARSVLPRLRALPRAGQGAGDLGRRMARAMGAPPAGPVVLVGADIPEIAAAHVATAFRALGAAEAVFGPAIDGGYWLVGLGPRARARPPFAGVRWSGPHALADTLANLGRETRVALLETLEDVDDGAAFRRWRARDRRREPARAGFSVRSAGASAR